MAVLKDFECIECGYFEQVVDGPEAHTPCPTCSTISPVVFLKAPGIPELESDFNPHYDLQLGEHFHTRKEKEKFLKDRGRFQVEGPVSPKKDSKATFKCSRNQARKLGPFASDLPKAPLERQRTTPSE